MHNPVMLCGRSGAAQFLHSGGNAVGSRWPVFAHWTAPVEVSVGSVGTVGKVVCLRFHHDFRCSAKLSESVGKPSADTSPTLSDTLVFTGFALLWLVRSGFPTVPTVRDGIAGEAVLEVSPPITAGCVTGLGAASPRSPSVSAPACAELARCPAKEIRRGL